MKIDRLIGILTTLQKNGKVTAPDLAQKFEVSRRTVNRDIEDLCRAGIPVVTARGGDGGISIMEGFNIDTTVFTEDELQAVFTGLKSLDSVSETSWAARLSHKLNAQGSAEMMSIDLASFYKDSLAEKIGLFKRAVDTKRTVSFRYYYEKGEADKVLEPYLLVFKWSDWYIFGFCRERQAFRLFKLNRLWQLRICDETFESREVPEGAMNFGSNIKDDLVVKAVFDPRVKYKLVEEYGPDSFTVREDGKLYAEYSFTDCRAALPWLLSFGEAAEVLDPPEVREKLRSAALSLLKKYDSEMIT